MVNSVDAGRSARHGFSRMPYIDRNDQRSWQTLNRSPFIFRHNLNVHPLFELSNLTKLAEKTTDGGLIVSTRRELNQLPPRERLSRAMAEIESGNKTGNNWIKISHLDELHVDYKGLLDDLIAEFEGLSGSALHQTITWKSMTVFIASPGVITPYHFDHDTNFLFQVRGDKDVYLFEPNDRFVLTEEEIETFYKGNAMAGKYREEISSRGKAYRLTPGLAVHHPPLAPHLVKNGDNPSISISVYYTSSDLDTRARIYQMNYCMRQLGLTPNPPGRSIVVDRLKETAIRAVSKSRPKTYDEHLYSGINRIRFPFRAANWMIRRLASNRRKDAQG